LDSLKDKRELKAKRKATQEENIKRKQEKKEGKNGPDYAFEKDEGAEKDDELDGVEANVDEDVHPMSKTSKPDFQTQASRKRSFGKSGLSRSPSQARRPASARGSFKQKKRN